MQKTLRQRQDIALSRKIRKNIRRELDAPRTSTHLSVVIRNDRWLMKARAFTRLSFEEFDERFSLEFPGCSYRVTELIVYQQGRIGPLIRMQSLEAGIEPDEVFRRINEQQQHQIHEGL